MTKEYFLKHTKMKIGQWYIASNSLGQDEASIKVIDIAEDKVVFLLEKTDIAFDCIEKHKLDILFQDAMACIKAGNLRKGYES